MSNRIVQAMAAVCLLLTGIATAQTAQEFWNEKFRSGLPNVRREPSLILVETLKQHPARPGSTALDLGCGEGRNLLFLAENGWPVTGVDISEVGIGQVRESLGPAHLDLHARLACEIEGQYISEDEEGAPARRPRRH